MATSVTEALKDRTKGIPPTKKRRVVIALVILAVIFAGWAVYKVVTKIEKAKYVKISGNIEGNDVRISFRVKGQIEELIADEGTVLKVGDIVARLNKDDLEKQKNEAAAALKLAEYQYQLDQLDYVRAENLFKEGAISAQDRDKAKTKSDIDNANVDKLRATLEIAELKLYDWADLKSPLNGYVITKSALQGEVVQEHRLLGEIILPGIRNPEKLLHGRPVIRGRNQTRFEKMFLNGEFSSPLSIYRRPKRELSTSIG
ncbi:MAG: efflux RND transporter periplasmic adaptor subunit [Candidatus Omnitrophica bacterium]|nr:efflux RND transporter periplasmic adaptor subunit [Candidatus Omnitrophota bacterium]